MTKAKKLAEKPTGEVPRAHSHIGASSMHRWSVCPGSVALSKDLPNKSSKYAEEGTEAHELAAYRLTEGVYDRHPLARNEEMLEAVQVYVEHVEGLTKTGAKLFVEHKFDLSCVYPGLFGTADAVVYDASTEHLYVIDYKHGQGIAVEPEENEQLMYYAVGALITLGLKVKQVELQIVQPRCQHRNGPIRSWVTTPERLLDFTLNLVDFAKATEAPDAVLTPGDHCRFCPAAGICPEIESKAQQLAQTFFKPLNCNPAIDIFSPIDPAPTVIPRSHVPTKNEGSGSLASKDGSYSWLNTVGAGSLLPAHLSPAERLSKLLHWLPILEGWMKSVRDYAYAEAEHGREIPGWKLVPRRATRKWTDLGDVSRFLENEFPQINRSFYESSLKSPAQVEKILPKSHHTLITPYISAISSGNTLVPETDHRQAIAPLSAESTFQPIKDELPSPANDTQDEMQLAFDLFS